MGMTRIPPPGPISQLPRAAESPRKHDRPAPELTAPAEPEKPAPEATIQSRVRWHNTPFAERLRMLLSGEAPAWITNAGARVTWLRSHVDRLPPFELPYPGEHEPIGPVSELPDDPTH